ncbi:MAG: IS200/IS605 family transposase [Thermoanaerobaculia bacterium]
MPSTHTSLICHIVFSTKNRDAWFDPQFRPRLHEYLGGCVRTAGGVALEVGGVADHVHLLVSLRATHRVSDIVRDIKQASSEWIHKETKRAAFAWQEGYGAFTVGAADVDRVRDYIRGQDAHHRGISFQEEYRKFLEDHAIAYDERYLW